MKRFRGPYSFPGSCSLSFFTELERRTLAWIQVCHWTCSRATAIRRLTLKRLAHPPFPPEKLLSRRFLLTGPLFPPCPGAGPPGEGPADAEPVPRGPGPAAPSGAGGAAGAPAQLHGLQEHHPRKVPLRALLRRARATGENKTALFFRSLIRAFLRTCPCGRVGIRRDSTDPRKDWMHGTGRGQPGMFV